MLHFVLESSPAVVSVALAMSTIWPALIASVRGAGTRTGDLQTVASPIFWSALYVDISVGLKPFFSGLVG